MLFRSALAGPVANWLMAVAFGLLFRVLWAVHASVPGFVLDAVFYLVLYNVLLGLFNLLPVPPLDGHSALGLILPESTFLKFLELVRTPTFSIVGLLVAYNVFPHLLWPVLQWSILTFYRVALAV